MGDMPGAQGVGPTPGAMPPAGHGGHYPPPPPYSAPYPGAGYHPYPPAFQPHPALRGAVPSTAGRQVLAGLIDVFVWVMLGGLLIFLSAVQAPFALSQLGGRSQRSTSRRSYASGFATSDDQLITVLIAVLVTLLFVIVLCVAALWLYSWCIATKGRTPGMYVMNQRLVSVGTGRPIGWGSAFVRTLVITVATMLTWIGGLVLLVSPFFDTRSGWAQGWADKMVSAVVIDTARGRDTHMQ